MERTDNEPSDWERLFGEIPVATSSSSPLSYRYGEIPMATSSSSPLSYRYDECYHDFLLDEDQYFPQSTQNHMGYDTDFETAFTRFSLSPTVATPPSPSSPSLYPSFFFYGNPIFDSFTTDPVYSTLPYDQMQHNAIELNRQKRIQDSLLSQTQGSSAEGLTLPGLGSYSNDQYRNGWSQSPPEGDTNGFFTRGGSTGIGFLHDSDGRFVDRAISEMSYLSHYRRCGYNVKNICDHYSLDELRRQMCNWARDQHGSRFLEKKFKEGTEEERAIIFSELKNCLCDLMLDQFGNCIVHKLIEMSGEEQRTSILIMVTMTPAKLTRICRNRHGCLVVENLLKNLSTQKQISIFMITLIPIVAILVKDLNGHRVVQCCVEHFSDKDNKYLYHAIADRCLEVAADRYGCFLLQRCLQLAARKERDRLVAEITKNALVLSQNEHGNFVVQFVVNMKVLHYTSNLIRQLEGNFVSLSMQKFSSNVVETCIGEARKEDSTRIIRELLESSNFLLILQDAFGNYVVQKALAVLKGPVRNAIVGFVQNHLPSLRNHLYGKRVIMSINSR